MQQREMGDVRGTSSHAHNENESENQNEPRQPGLFAAASTTLPPSA
ncbi:hypothetical protein BCL93_101412 [Onishia taeanensis]|uniref:Uncharacterized protein n=1 Tax=Onishia taeanensis TaxID=284577 RepID=A0A328XWE4_9GAMM|nr:hypothetical protein BCL93_101412 [Halomonas taeanensis]